MWTTTVCSCSAGSGATERGGQVPTEADWAQIYTLRNGLIWRVENYSDRQQALEAMGLRE